MIRYQDKKLCFYWEGEILFCDYYVKKADLDFVEFGIKKRREITGIKDFVMISDIRSLNEVTREARERMSADDAKGAIAVGVIIESKVQKVIYNFFHAIYKQPTPAKLFNNKEDAIIWIQQYLPKKNE